MSNPVMILYRSSSIPCRLKTLLWPLANLFANIRRSPSHFFSHLLCFSIVSSYSSRNIFNIKTQANCSYISSDSFSILGDLPCVANLLNRVCIFPQTFCRGWTRQGPNYWFQVIVSRTGCSSAFDYSATATAWDPPLNAHILEMASRIGNVRTLIWPLFVMQCWALKDGGTMDSEELACFVRKM